MPMKQHCLAVFLACSLLALPAQAQDPKKSEPADEKPAAGATQETDRPQRAPGQTPDPKIIEGILHCLAEGLTQDWKKAWFVISEVDRNVLAGTRQFEGNFFFATSEKDRKGMRLQTCGAEKIIQGVSDLNDYLTKDQQRWTSATFTFLRDGNYDVKYDYTPFKPKPAAKPTAKKKPEAAK